MKITILITALLYLIISAMEAANSVNAFEVTSIQVIFSMLAIVGANLMFLYLIFHKTESRLLRTVQIVMVLLWLVEFFTIALIGLDALTVKFPRNLASAFVFLQSSMLWVWIYFHIGTKEQITS